MGVALSIAEHSSWFTGTKRSSFPLPPFCWGKTHLHREYGRRKESPRKQSLLCIDIAHWKYPRHVYLGEQNFPQVQILLAAPPVLTGELGRDCAIIIQSPTQTPWPKCLHHTCPTANPFVPTAQTIHCIDYYGKLHLRNMPPHRTVASFSNHSSCHAISEWVWGVVAALWNGTLQQAITITSILRSPEKITGCIYLMYCTINHMGRQLSDNQGHFIDKYFWKGVTLVLPLWNRLLTRCGTEAV